MKIAIVAPSPVPFTVGGAEKLWWGLQNELNRHTSHQAELIKLPAPEDSFWAIVDSYERFWRLDLSHFDLVISGKYPGWMVRHPNHICYMLHRLRGFYDCFHFLGLPETYGTSNPSIVGLQRRLQSTQASNRDVEDVFANLHELRNKDDLPAEAFAFPGSLIREVVRFFDNSALHPGRIRRYAAISKNVAGRPDYFPAGIEPAVIYPPSNLEGLHCNSFDYILTASRLDQPKRINLAIEAMRFVECDIELRISGEGRQEAQLKELAGSDSRIQFLGYRSDADLVNDYANALAVIFCPYDEDYGLITVEAMASGKPVITAQDSGGPNEFVVTNETGFSVPPDPEQIATQIAWLAQHRDAARSMGRRAKSVVEQITWKHACERLLQSVKSRRPGIPECRTRRGIVVATTFPITPVRGGGQARIFNLYKNLYPSFETNIVTLTGHEEAAFNAEIAPGVREIRIPKSKAHAAAEAEISRDVEWFPVTDVAFGEIGRLTPAYTQALERYGRDAEAVIASHPYVIGAIEEVCNKPLWYQAHNVEYILKEAVIPKTSRGLELIRHVETIERRCCDHAEVVLAVQRKRCCGITPSLQCISLEAPSSSEWG